MDARFFAASGLLRSELPLLLCGTASCGRFPGRCGAVVLTLAMR